MATPDQRAIRSVAVLGGGIVGLSAALAFARALPLVPVTIVATPPDPAALADRLPGGLPAIHRFHAAIGVDEADLVRRRIALHHLGTRFEGWSASGGTWYHAFGEHGLPAGIAPFHQVWARARREGAASAFHLYCAAAVLAEAGKFVHPSADPDSPLSRHLYGLRFDPEPYRGHLRALAEALPIRWVEGSFGKAERRQDGGVAAIFLEGGGRVEADLFLDCSGPSALLLSALEPGFEDWGDSLPADRVRLSSASSDLDPSPGDSVIAVPRGWSFASAVPGRVVTGSVSRGRATPLADDEVAIRPGRRPEPWVRNVLALGDAAVALDPLANANLHAAQNAIQRALELLPGRDCHALELREYNRRTAQETTRIRDFLALHYLRSGRGEGTFWEGLRRRPLPDSLALTVEQFEARGRLPFFEEESFDKDSWLAVLLGLGVVPRRIDPAAAAVTAGEAEPAIRAYAARIAALPARLPGYRDYLARMVTAPASSARAPAAAPRGAPPPAR